MGCGDGKEYQLGPCAGPGKEGQLSMSAFLSNGIHAEFTRFFRRRQWWRVRRRGGLHVGVLAVELGHATWAIRRREWDSLRRAQLG